MNQHFCWHVLRSWILVHRLILSWRADRSLPAAALRTARQMLGDGLWPVWLPGALSSKGARQAGNGLM